MVVSTSVVPSQSASTYSPAGQLRWHGAHTRSLSPLPLHGTSLYSPVGFRSVGPEHCSWQLAHTPSYSEDALHMVRMNWFCAHPVPELSEHGTHRLVSAKPRPVHCPASTSKDLHVVWLQGAQRVVSRLVVPSHTPTWYCPGWQLSHGTQRVVSNLLVPSHLPIR